MPEMIITMMNKVSSVTGLENTIDEILRVVLDHIGGSNLIIYYLIDNDIFYADMFGKKMKIDKIDDVLVKKVFETREPVECERDFRDTKMTTPELTKASTWVFPLVVGSELTGVFKMEDLRRIKADELRPHLPIFLNYIALILKNEIQVYTKLKSAYEQVSRTNAELTGEIAERKRAENALFESERKYRDLFDEIFDGFFITSPAGKIIDINKKGVLMFGYDSKEEMLSLDLEKDVYADPLDRKRLLSIINERGTGEYEVVFKKKNGEKMVAHLGLTAAKDESGGITAYRSIIRDITEQRRTEWDLKLVNFALNTVHEAAFLIDENAGFHYVNEEACRILGYSREELLGLGVTDIDPDFPSERWPGHWNDFKTQRSFTFEGRHKTKDGRIFPVEISVNYFDYEGQGYNLALVRDITERKQAEKDLRFTQYVVDNMPDGTEWIRPDATFFYVNKVSCEQAGYTKEELLQIAVNDIDPNFPASRWKSFWEEVRERKVWTFETAHIAKDRHLVPVEVTASLLEYEGAEFLCAFVRDITERKQTENTIRALNATLESRLLALTQPVGDVSNIHLSDLFNIDELQKIQDAFALATGVASIITDTQGRPITKPSNFCRLCEHIIRKTDKGLINCCRSDASLGRMYPQGPIMQRCLSGGLWDAGTSICVGDQHVANWLIGQVLEEPVNEEAMLAYAREIGADEEEFRKALAEVTRMPLKQFEKIVGALYLIANQLSKLAIQNVQQARFITERKRAQEALEKSALEIEDLYNNAPCGYHSLDPQGVFVRVNATELKWLGYTRDEVIGKLKFYDLLTPESLAVFEKKFSEFKTRGWLHDLEFEMIRKDGSVMPVLLSATAIRDPHGNYVMSRSTMYDITERRHAEEEIRRWNVELERRVAERTGQLEIANNELEAFSYSVSHDLRAPLRSAGGFSQILLETYADRLDTQAKDYLTRIRGATQQMAQLIDDLLKLSRIARSEISRKDVDLSALSHAVADELRKTEPDRQVKFVIAPNLRIHADENLIRIVMENLLANAWKFTRKVPNAQIEVGLTRQEGKTVYFVRDNGAGFDEAYAGKLFTPFQRLHSATEYEGTGIGLSIVQRIIRRHNGQIWAQGRVEKGATFSFTTSPASLNIE